MYKNTVHYVMILSLLVLPWWMGGCDNTAEYATQSSAGSSATGAVRTVAPKPPQEKSTAWYIRLNVKNVQTGQHFSGAKFGVLDTDNATRAYSLKAFGSIGSNGIDLVFQDETGSVSGDLLVYYLQPENGVRQEWPFTVRSGDSHATIALKMEGFYALTSYIDDEDRIRFTETRTMDDPVLKQMKLVDSETGEEIPVMRKGKAVVYIFDMNGNHIHHFKWVKETEPVQIPLSGNQVFSAKEGLEKSRVRQSANKALSNVPLKRENTFDITKPPKAE